MLPADRHSVWTGGCHCGDCCYEFKGDPPHSGYCHCDMCKKTTGGPFAVLVQTDRAALMWRGRAPSSYRSSPIATRGFCPRCGTPLYLHYDDDSIIRLPVGSLDRPERITPQGHYGVESRLPWADCGQGLPEQETQERF
ncbi:GFA family protein [Rhizobium wenxiniae]|uniref:GFA family protein n=1 Tax=Rhizobium wenxiniae TaxID=1737357 RepID=UPI001CB76E6C